MKWMNLSRARGSVSVSATCEGDGTYRVIRFEGCGVWWLTISLIRLKMPNLFLDINTGAYL